MILHLLPQSNIYQGYLDNWYLSRRKRRLNFILGLLLRIHKGYLNDALSLNIYVVQRTDHQPVLTFSM